MRNVKLIGLAVPIVALFAFLFGRFSSGNLAHKQRGVSWVAGPQVVTEDDLMNLAEKHVNWIVQTPFGWQNNYDSPTLQLITDSRILWGETDIGLETTTALARKAGIKTLLKPHIWLRNRSDGKWRSDIEMASEEDWQSWFNSYREFILHYARLAERTDMEALAIGAELRTPAVRREQDWRELIAEVRKVYSGLLTYSANWYLEFEEIQFWDALDFIGIQAYFPLTQNPNPTIDELMAGWQPHVAAIEHISRKFDKPVLFTEIGYKSSSDAAITPWEWPRRRGETASDEELQTQASCYEAFFKTFWEKEWVAGAYFWKWFPRFRNPTGPSGRDFTPQSKPAEQVMVRWYGKSVD